MAISQELVSIKSAGTYRREFDLSAMQPTYESTYSRGRILPGFSYKGPFNKPFKIVDSDQFVSIFGNIDPKLEANGCFFHRTAIEMLKAGPIIALNLHSYKDSKNVADGYAIGTKYATPFRSPIKGIFSTSLWYEPWPDRLRDSYGTLIEPGESYQLCDFADTSEEYAIWNEDADHTRPNYMNVALITEDVSIDEKECPCYATLQHVGGDGYPSTVQPTPIGKIHLCRYIKDEATGDAVLDETCVPLDIFLYAKEDYTDYANYVLSLPLSDRGAAVAILNEDGRIKIAYESEPIMTTETEFIYFDIQKLTTPSIGNRILIDPCGDIHLKDEDVFEDGHEFIYLANASGNDIRAYVYKTPSDTSTMLAYNIPLSDYYGGNLPFELQEYMDEKGYDVKDYTLADFMFTLVIFNDVKTLSNDMLDLEKSWGFNHPTDLQFIRQDNALFDCNGMSGVYTYTGASVPGLVNASGVDISIDTWLRNLAQTTNLIGFTVPYCEKGTPAKKSVIETVRMNKIETGVEPCAQNPDNYKAILNTLRNPDDTVVKYAVTERDAKTGKFNPEPSTPDVWGRTNMWRAITDRMVVSFRYLVDCWGYGIEIGSKNIFSKICLAQHATGLLNAPSALSLTKVDEFTDEFGGIIYKNLATSEVFSVPNIKDGATHVGYFYPWNRKGAKLLPPAGAVSNLFLQKMNPWSVAAGVTGGPLPGYNPETPLSTQDREWLEAMGINAIIDAGDDQHTICVYGNKTAKQKPVSALSALSFRDFVVYIMDEIENIIRPYVFKENTEAVRTEIVSKCTTFLKSVTSTPDRVGGLEAFEVIMNSTNNTKEIIDNFYGVLDIKIEGVRPMEKIAQRLYILPTGALTANAE